MFLSLCYVRLEPSWVGKRTSGSAPQQGKAPYQGMQTYVFSRTLMDDADGSVRIVSGDAGAFVRHLKNEKGKGICLMRGGEFVKPLFEARLINEIGFNIHPVLPGSGIPLSHEMAHQIDLELPECNTFKNGCVFVGVPRGVLKWHN